MALQHRSQRISAAAAAKSEAGKPISPASPMTPAAPGAATPARSNLEAPARSNLEAILASLQAWSTHIPTILIVGMSGEKKGAQELFEMFRVFARYEASIKQIPTKFVDDAGELDAVKISEIAKAVRDIKQNIIQESPSPVESARISYGGSKEFNVIKAEYSPANASQYRDMIHHTVTMSKGNCVIIYCLRGQ